jgi:hypothetical protein
MSKGVNTGTTFCDTMAHYVESLMERADYAGVIRYYESNRDTLENAGSLPAGTILHQAAMAYASQSNYVAAFKNRTIGPEPYCPGR